jgi:hypothetical protein
VVGAATAPLSSSMIESLIEAIITSIIETGFIEMLGFFGLARAFSSFSFIFLEASEDALALAEQLEDGTRNI